jgi:hypothetical protein
MHALISSLVLASALLPQAGSLAYTTPSAWKTRPAASSMRIAEFVVPRAPEDAEDAEVVIFFFAGGGGSVEANIERWIGQFEASGGGPAKPLGRTSFPVGPLKVTTIDVNGTYVAETRPGSGQRLNKPKFAMRAAIVETPRGPYFIKLTGPQATVTQSLPAFDAFLKSLAYK